MQLSFAPLEGITGYRFRNAHARWFGAADRYFTPFPLTTTVPDGQPKFRLTSS